MPSLFPSFSLLLRVAIRLCVSAQAHQRPFNFPGRILQGTGRQSRRKWFTVSTFQPVNQLTTQMSYHSTELPNSNNKYPFHSSYSREPFSRRHIPPPNNNMHNRMQTFTIRDTKHSSPVFLLSASVVLFVSQRRNGKIGKCLLRCKTLCSDEKNFSKSSREKG